MATANSKQLPPALLAVFGITGDLAGRKLLPAIYELARKQQLPDSFLLVGITRRGTTPAAVIARIREHVGAAADEATLRWLEPRIQIITMDLTKLEAYEELKTQLEQYEQSLDEPPQRLFYLAIPAQSFNQVVDLLAQAGLQRGGSRLLVEKPFGFDLASAQMLIDGVSKHFDESQVYRIDHFLAKPAAQAVLPFRAEHPDLEARLNNHQVASITVIAAEAIGIENRAVFYEQTGALRDVLQSHLLQLLTLVTLDLPPQLSAEAIHAQKLAVLRAITPITAEHAVRGQYQQYRGEVDNPASRIETFAAVRLRIANQRWQGVPVLLLTGKGLTRKLTEITINFKDGTRLRVGIDPHTGISLSDGPSESTPAADAYELLLRAAIHGEQTLFASSQEVLAAWRIITPLLQAWAQDTEQPATYQSGSWGSPELASLTRQADIPWPPR